MKYFAIFSCLLLLAFPLRAEETYLRDVPEGHYAYDAVHDLVSLGVTNGFPDGTYRGKNFITRYEIAAFISKLARAKNLDRAASEKLLAELRSEVAALKAQDEPAVAADLQTRWRQGVTPAGSGGGSDYRLQTTVEKEFGREASLKFGLDTMDAGFNGPTRDLARELIDLEGKVSSGPAELKVTDGPGDVVHTDDGLFPAENNVIYARPRRAVYLSSRLGRTLFSLGYLSRSSNISGALSSAETSALIVQELAAFKFSFNPRVFTGPNDSRDTHLDLTGEFRPNRLFSSGVTLGIAKTADWPHGLYLRGDLDLGGGLRLLAQKIGSQFRQLVSYSITDLFDRALNDGSTNYGLELKRDLAGWSVKASGDYTDPGQVVTTELRVGHSLAAAADLELVYQAYDGTALGFSRSLGMVAGFKL